MKKPSVLEKEFPHFIDQIIKEDLLSGKHSEIVTRFPPEPNGYLHIGHAKAFCLNFGYARDNANAKCHLRFDDTNPEKESNEYVESIQKDIKWMGFDWGENLFFASDYFEKVYQFAVELIQKGMAYIDQQTPDEINANRGNLTEPGKESPYRNRPVEESLTLFAEMKAGKHPDGAMVLRGKIDMNSPNMNMRDPILYRIRHVHHHRTGDQWCIYPMYDFVHPLSDAIEGITHSLCSLEFEDHRPLYDWAVQNTSVIAKPRQIEFARLNLSYCVMSKRKLIQLVEEKHVTGWDDPRMPTISGMRRRGYTPSGITNFMEYISIGKKDTLIEYELLEKFIRDDLATTCKRAMGVIDPLKVTLTNWEEGKEFAIEAPFHSQDASFGARTIKLTKEFYIEQTDFLKDPPSPKKWFRLGPDRSVRLRYGPIITCDEFVCNEQGDVIELKCRYIEDSFHGQSPEGAPKVKGIIHWVNAADAQDVQVNVFDKLFTQENPLSDKDIDFLTLINPESHKTIIAKVEPYLMNLKTEERVQFERLGYFVADLKESLPGKPVFNKILGL
jgi:glutaminyl-tRNA synthetase